MLESKRRAIIFIGLALVLALLAGFLVLQKVSQLNADLGGMTEIYVADGNISSRQVIKPSDVTKKEVPNRYVKDTNYIISKKDLINKVSVVPLTEGDIITQNVLKPVSNVINENSRLVTIYSTEKVGFDTRLEEADRVDIVVSHNFDGKPKTEIFMKDVPVARIAKNTKEDFVGVALEVSVTDAPRLIHMQNYADSMRILKANVSQSKQEETKESSEGTKQTKQETKQEEQSTDKKTEQSKQPPAEKEKKSAK